MGSVPEYLPRAKNIFWIGKRPYGEMPDYAFGFRVGIVPFVVNEATRRQRPIKVNEYLMAGLPVVCTDLPEVRRDFGALVSVTASTDEFVAACWRALGDPDREAIERGRQAMSRHKWSQTAAVIERHVDAVVAEEGRLR